MPAFEEGLSVVSREKFLEGEHPRDEEMVRIRLITSANEEKKQRKTHPRYSTFFGINDHFILSVIHLLQSPSQRGSPSKRLASHSLTNWLAAVTMGGVRDSAEKASVVE